MAESVPLQRLKLPKIRTIDPDSPWKWLNRGWRDMTRAPTVSVTYGVLFALAGWILTLLIWVLQLFHIVLPLAAGFMLVGPLFCVGLYDVSRRLDQGEPVSLGTALTAWRGNMTQIALMGLVLVFILLVWLRIATLVFALFFSANPPRPEPLFLLDVFVSASSVPFLAVGTAIGGLLAVVVFAVSAISIPLLLDRDSNVVVAVAASVEAVRRNFWPMALWAWLIALFIGAGIVTGYFGLILTLPLIGHASWHAYRDLIEWDGD